MPEFLNTQYYGNTVAQWLFALVLIVTSVIAGRVLYWIFQRWARLLTRRTKTLLDDIIIDMVEEPVVGIFVLIGIRYALGTLTLSEGAEVTLANVYKFVVAVIVALTAPALIPAV